MVVKEKEAVQETALKSETVKAPKVSKKVEDIKKEAKKTAGKKVKSINKLRIKVSAYEHKILDTSVKQIMDTAFKFDAEVRGPVPLPTSIKKYTVNRSTFIFKDAREQFEMRVHKRLIDIISPSQKVIEALTNLNLPSGVDIDVKLM